MTSAINRTATSYTSFAHYSTFNSSSSASTRTLRPARNSTGTSTQTSTATGASASDTNNGAALEPSTPPNANPQSQYFYVLIAVGVSLTLFCLWLAYKRRKLVKVTRDTDRQRALAQDAQGWRPSRIWQNGRGRDGAVDARSMHNEGLDERGEAPPPYLHGEPAVVGHGEPIPTYDGGDGIPLQTFTMRGDIHSMKPPDYLETVIEARGSSSSSRLDEDSQRSSHDPQRGNSG